MNEPAEVLYIRGVLPGWTVTADGDRWTVPTEIRAVAPDGQSVTWRPRRLTWGPTFDADVSDELWGTVHALREIMTFKAAYRPNLLLEERAALLAALPVPP